MTIGCMAGFSLFGKNFVNIWPIIIGNWLYALCHREHFLKHTQVALLSTALSPLVGFMALREGASAEHLLMALFAGLAIGFVMPPLANYTYRIHNGMNIYNTGFAAGLLAMILVPIVTAFGAAPESAYYWSTEYHNQTLIYLLVLLLVLLVMPFLLDRRVLSSYRKLVLSRGHLPNDYLEKFGAPAVMLNTALCGGIGLAYILITGGVLNGATLGSLFVIMGCSAFGKNPRNIIPIMAGVMVGGYLNTWPINAPAPLIAGLLCTTLAPITDYFGTVVGMFAGFLHSSVVLYAGSPLAGLNLYNNGFSAGLVATVLYPVLTRFLKHHRAKFETRDFLETSK
jgi:MFS family permease